MAAPVNNGTTQSTQSVGKYIGKHWGSFLGLGFMVNDYIDYRHEGDTRLGALGRASLSFLLPELMGGGAYFGFLAASAAPGAILSGAQSLSQNMRAQERNIRDQSPFRTNTFVDSQQIYTMRQAGLALAEQSKYALQQSLMGDEARFMHR